jgi:hypothetical protein
MVYHTNPAEFMTSGRSGIISLPVSSSNVVVMTNDKTGRMRLMNVAMITLRLLAQAK